MFLDYCYSDRYNNCYNTNHKGDEIMIIAVIGLLTFCLIFGMAAIAINPREDADDKTDRKMGQR
jgi:hypothetical protein